jgi:RimJ/RimL family protein N-acetyltransferase
MPVVRLDRLQRSRQIVRSLPATFASGCRVTAPCGIPTSSWTLTDAIVIKIHLGVISLFQWNMRSVTCNPIAKAELMSLEYALEKYPGTTVIKNGLECVIRPLAKKDDVKLHKFLLSVPEVERMFIKQPVTDRTLARQWCQHADFESNLPLLMLHNNQVIGQATLHQRPGGWRRHIGVVTVLTHPEYRGRDVAKILVEHVVDVARHLGLKKLEARLNGERKIAIKALEQIGFRTLLYLPDYVLDMQSRPHDYVLMGMDLITDEEYAGSA